MSVDVDRLLARVTETLGAAKAVEESAQTTLHPVEPEPEQRPNRRGRREQARNKYKHHRIIVRSAAQLPPMFRAAFDPRRQTAVACSCGSLSLCLKAEEAKTWRAHLGDAKRKSLIGGGE